MPGFRVVQPGEESGTATGAPALEQVRQLADDVLRPGHFFLSPGLALEWEHMPGEEVSWELFRGRLLDPGHTTRRQRFESWNLFLVDGAARSAEPFLSLKLDAAARQLHITRALFSYTWEAYEGGDRVILTRETRKWVRELAGTIDLDRFTSTAELGDEMICRLFLAVVGSRLPLTSVEAPLPAFSLGQLAYCHRPGLNPGAEPLRSYRDLVQKFLTAELAWVEKAKLLETLLHATPETELVEAADLFMARWRMLPRNGAVLVRSATVDPLCGKRAAHPAGAEWHPRQDLVALLLTLFNEASLSPYTDLVDKTLVFVRVLERRGDLTSEDVAYFLSRLLRQLGRHLTAYDLVTFHHRGANYPDALLLDAALKAYLELAERQPSLFASEAGEGEAEARARRLRRRALREAWLLRRHYEGHLVPEAPTSQGENLRVLPPPHIRVPEEQIFYPHRRTRRLFDGDPLDRHLSDRTRSLLRQSIADLRHVDELRELGMALFVDRPLDAGKDAVEPDQTLLLSYLAFSRSIAERRLRYLADDLGLIPDREEYATYRHRLEHELQVKGLAVNAVGGTRRAGAVSLADARRAADDFLFLRNTDRSKCDFWDRYSLARLPYALADLNTSILIVRQVPEKGRTESGLAVYDSLLRKRLELDFDPQPGYASRGGGGIPGRPAACPARLGRDRSGGSVARV